jgi:hypothetical protein
MPTFVVRVWVPDRPGALGAVASRIGAVRGDLVGIDILERGAGRAIDELVVELPSDSLIPLLTSEIGQVDGVDVEDIRPVGETAVDARLDALESAASLVAQATVPRLLDALVAAGPRDFGAEWAAVVDLEAPAPGSGRLSPAAASRLRRPRPTSVPTTWPGPSWRLPPWSSCWAAGVGRSEPRNAASSPPWRGSWICAGRNSSLAARGSSIPPCSTSAPDPLRPRRWSRDDGSGRAWSQVDQLECRFAPGRVHRWSSGPPGMRVHIGSSCDPSCTGKYRGTPAACRRAKKTAERAVC